MEVILREEVSNLGKAGDIVKVKDGYARNYLLPKGLAFLATEGNKRRVAAEADRIAKQRAVEKEGAESLAKRIEGIQLTFRVKVGEENKLFGSVTASDIQRRLDEQGMHVEKRQVDLPEPIRELGEYPVGIKVHPDVRAEIRVTVLAEE
jgi:large subunit ribosomal protein L9